MWDFVYISVYRSTNIWFGIGRIILWRGGVWTVGDRRHCNREGYGIWFTIICNIILLVMQYIYDNVTKLHFPLTRQIINHHSLEVRAEPPSKIIVNTIVIVSIGFDLKTMSLMVRIKN